MTTKRICFLDDIILDDEDDGATFFVAGVPHEAEVEHYQEGWADVIIDGRRYVTVPTLSFRELE